MTLFIAIRRRQDTPVVGDSLEEVVEGIARREDLPVSALEPSNWTERTTAGETKHVWEDGTRTVHIHQVVDEPLSR